MHTEESLSMNDALSFLSKFIQGIGTKWISFTYASQCTVLLAVLLLKNTIGVETTNIRDAYLPASKSLPRPEGYFSASLGNLAIAKILGVRSVNSWIALHVLLLIAVLLFVAFIARQSYLAPAGILILFIATIPVTGTLFSTIGKYDVITFLGAVIVGLTRQRTSMLAGTLIMLLGNPEQAVVALVCLLIVSGIEEFRLPRSLIRSCLIFSIFFYLGIQIWMISSGVMSNRITLLPLWLGKSLSSFINAPFNNIWSWYGPVWLVILATILKVFGNERRRLLVSVLIIPGVATIVTADGLRVFGIIALPSLLTCCGWVVRSLQSNRELTRIFSGILITLWVITPTSSGGGFIWGKLSTEIASHLQPLSETVLDLGQRFE
jgi:hypothetical protein